MKAIIGTNGVFRQLLVAVAPSAALAAAAMGTVRTWTYHPLMSNGKPMEVHTTINVNFQLRH